MLCMTERHLHFKIFNNIYVHYYANSNSMCTKNVSYCMSHRLVIALFLPEFCASSTCSLLVVPLCTTRKIMVMPKEQATKIVKRADPAVSSRAVWELGDVVECAKCEQNTATTGRPES